MNNLISYTESLIITQRLSGIAKPGYLAIAFLFFIIGLALVIFERHVSEWWMRLGTTITKHTLQRDWDEDKMNTRFFASKYNKFSGLVLRLMGFMLAVFSAYIIYILIFRA